jgi:hypothetical protein
MLLHGFSSHHACSCLRQGGIGCFHRQLLLLLLLLLLLVVVLLRC